jgi:hypothetical protein
VISRKDLPARFPRPALAALKWSCITVATVVAVVPLLSTRRATPRARTAVEPDQSLSLTMTGEGGRISLGWDRNFAAIRMGGCGLLWIADGDVHRRVVLDASQLAAGKLFYWPVNKDVSFELKMIDRGGSSGGPACETGDTSRPELAESSTSPKLQRELSVSRNRRNAVRAATQMKTDPADQAGTEKKLAVLPPSVAAATQMDSQISMPESPHVTLSPVQAVVEERIFAATKRPLLAPAPEPRSTVSVETVPESQPARFVDRIPLLGKRGRNREFVGPRPVHKAIPQVPIELSQGLKEQPPVDVRVYVDERGKVHYAELLSDAIGLNRDLASLAVFNARRWEFTPARLEGHTAPGQVILRYRFSNPLVIARDRR